MRFRSCFSKTEKTVTYFSLISFNEDFTRFCDLACLANLTKHRACPFIPTGCILMTTVTDSP